MHGDCVDTVMNTDIGMSWYWGVELSAIDTSAIDTSAIDSSAKFRTSMFCS